MRNKGVASALIGAVTQYSAGFYFLGAQRASVYKCEALDNIYGFFLQKSDRCTIRECRADNNLLAGSNIGEGFTDIGPAGTAALPQQSTSMFEGNSAYNNGAGTAHVGPNGNYNIWVNAGTSIRPLLLECVNATSACVIDPTNPGGIYLAGKHNLSTVN